MTPPSTAPNAAQDGNLTADLDVAIHDDGDSFRLASGNVTFTLTGDEIRKFKANQMIYAGWPGRDAAFVRGFMLCAEIIHDSQRQGKTNGEG